MTHAARRIGYALTLATALSVIGCNSSSTDPAPAGGALQGLVAPCAFLTQVEVEAIFGKAVDSMKADTTHYITHCSYMGSVEPGRVLPTHLDLTIWTTTGVQAHQGSTLTAASVFANLKTATPNRDDVPGTGDGAFWQKTPGKLTLYKGNTYVEIIYSPLGKIVDTSAVAKAGAIAAGVKAAEKI